MIRCFLIDDDLDDQEIFQMALADIDKNIECEVANDGEEAIDILQSIRTEIPHYIFIDVNMPKMNGVACLKASKNLKHIGSAEVYMFSTSSEQRMIDICIELGARDFIIKPDGLSILTERLKRVFESGPNITN